MRSLCELFRDSNKFVFHYPSLLHLIENATQLELIDGIAGFEAEEWFCFYQWLSPQFKAMFFTICWDIITDGSTKTEQLEALKIIRLIAQYKAEIVE